MKKLLPEWIVGVLLGGIVFCLYMVTLSRGAAPGPSAGLLLGVLDLFPRLAPEAPFWHAIAGGLAAMSGTQAVGVLNAFSAVCAAVSVWLLYEVMRRGVQHYLDPYLLHEGRQRFVGTVAGFVAAVGLGLCAPFWSVATRAHMMTFDIMLLLFAGWLLIRFIESGRFLYAVILCLGYGWFAAEFATMVVIGPVFAMGLLYALWRHEILLPRRIGILAGLVVTGIVTGYLLAAVLFYREPGYVLRDYQGFWNLMWAIWLGQAQQISRSLPREGWLIILFTTTVPWLTMFAVAKRGLNDDRDKALVFLHMIMTVFAGAIWLHVPLTPWVLLGWQRLLITPYLLVAMVSGYLAVFWLLVAGEWGKAREEGWLAVLRFGAGGMLSLAMLGLVLVAPWWFAGEARAKGSVAARTVAREVVESLDGRTWLISDGVLDAHYYLAGWEQGVPLNLLSLPSGNQIVYQRFVASLFEETRLKNAVMLSLYAFLQEWFKEPSVVGDVAVLQEADLLRRLGYEAVPQKLVYVGMAPDTVAVGAQSVDQAVGFMADWSEQLQGLEADDGISDQIQGWSRAHAGRLGNDLGVLLEDAGQPDAAHRVYRAVRELDPDNISVLLNLASMASAGLIPDPDGAIKAKLDALADGLTERLQIWSLARTYGIVRSPEAFAQMGWSWAYSGQARMAVSQLERATELQGANRSPAMDALMAEAYMLDNRAEESASMYRAMLDREGQRMLGLAGLYRLALRGGEILEARGLLEQLAAGGMPAERVVLEEAMLDMLEGRAAAALARLDDFMVEHRDLLRGWVLMAEAGFALQDERTINRALRRIELLEGNRGYFASLLRGRLAFQASDFRLAAEFYEAALQRRPGHLPLMEQLLRLGIVLQRRDLAERQMRALLHVQPAHAMALYVRGSLQMADGDTRLAEDSFRQSLAAERLPLALNDLAWLLTQREAYEEAEKLAREGLEVHSDQAATWDTLGVILMRTGRLEEAEAAFSRSLALDAGQVMVLLHQAELQILRGREDAAREILGQFEAQRDRLGDEALALWTRLRQSLR